ncbi:MAG: hypothetical protein WCF35_09910, partial [Pseudolabrys sp.]
MKIAPYQCLRSGPDERHVMGWNVSVNINHTLWQYEPSELVLPKNDRHIIITVHYYLPMTFTHQGANWTPEYANLSGNTW